MITQKNFNVYWNGAIPIISFQYNYNNGSPYYCIRAGTEIQGIEKEKDTDAGLIREEKDGKLTNRVIYWVDQNYFALTLEEL